MSEEWTEKQKLQLEIYKQRGELVRLRQDLESAKRRVEFLEKEFTTPSNRYPDCGRCRRRAVVMHQVKQENHELRRRDRFREGSMVWALDKYVAELTDLRRARLQHHVEAQNAARCAEQHGRIMARIDRRIDEELVKKP